MGEARNDLMPRIYSIGLDQRTMYEMMSLLADLGVQEVVDIRTTEEAEEHGTFNRQVFKDALEAASIQYLSLDGLLPPPSKPDTGEPDPGLGAAADIIHDQLDKYTLALTGNGSDPDAVFGTSTLVLTLLDRGALILLVGPNGEPDQVARSEHEKLVGRRSSNFVSSGKAMLAAIALSATALAVGLYPYGNQMSSSLEGRQVDGYHGDYDEYMVSNIDSSVIYDKDGTPYKRLPNGQYVLMTKDNVDDDQNSGSHGGHGSSGSYWRYYDEGQSFHNGTAKPNSRMSIARGGFGGSSAVHPSSSFSSSGPHSSSGAHVSGGS